MEARILHPGRFPGCRLSRSSALLSGLWGRRSYINRRQRAFIDLWVRIVFGEFFSGHRCRSKLPTID
jgi:hypothetical protein